MNIKADSTIVASAGALARAKVPFSMRGMTAGLLQQRGELLDSISTNFEKSMQEIEGINAEAKEAMEKLAKNANDGTVNNAGERAEMQDQLDTYREELKNIPLFGKENKRKRADLLYRINKYTKAKQTEGQIGNDIITSYNTNAYDVGLTGAPAIAFVKNVANHYNGDATDSSFKIETIDGKRVFSFTYTDGDNKTISFERQSIEDISKLLRKRDTSSITSVNTILNDARKSAKNNTKLEKQDVLQEIQNNLEDLFSNNPDGFASVARTKMFGQSTSYYDALHNPDSPESKQILDVLFSMKPELDENNDNIITKEDFATPENYEEFIKSLVDPNPQERTLAHSLAAKFYADEEGGRAVDLGIKYRADEEKTGSGGGDDGVNGFYKSNALWNGQQVPVTAHEKLKRRNSIIERDTVEGKFGRYEWDDSTQMYVEYNFDGEKVGELTPYGVAQQELAVRSNETRNHKDFQTTLDAGGDEGQDEITGGAEWRAINVDNDDDAAKNLNNYFADTDFSKKYKFVPQYGSTDVFPGVDPNQDGILGADNPLSDDIMLVDLNTGNPVVVNGKTLRFETGMLGEEAAQKIIDEINSIDILKPYREQKRRLLMDAAADPNNPN